MTRGRRRPLNLGWSDAKEALGTESRRRSGLRRNAEEHAEHSLGIFPDSLAYASVPHYNRINGAFPRGDWRRFAVYREE
jgi:hypothetical protein